MLHRLGPTFLDTFRLRAVPATAGTLRAVEALREVYASGGRRWPGSLPTSFLRAAWRDAVHDAGSDARRVWEAATLLALRDRLRAGDIWVEGSRQWRAVEDQLIPPALFAAMREAGPLPVAVPATAEAYIAERRATLDRRLAEVAAKAAADRLEDVHIAGDALRISPLKEVTSEEAGLPPQICNRVYSALTEAFAKPVLHQRLVEMGNFGVIEGPAEFARRTLEDDARLGRPARRGLLVRTG